MRWIGLVLVLVLVPAGVCEGKAKLKPEQRYNRLWRKVDRFYGQQGQPAPTLQIRPPSANPGATGEADLANRTIVVSPASAKQATSRKMGERRAGRRPYLHEWTHLFGPKGSGPTTDESVAYRMENRISHQLNKQARRKKARDKAIQARLQS